MERNTTIRKFLAKFEGDRKVYYSYKERDFYSILSIKEMELQMYEDKEIKKYLVATLGEDENDGPTMTITQLIPYLANDDVELLVFNDNDYYTIEDFWNAGTALERIHTYSDLPVEDRDIILQNDGEFTN